MSMAWHAMGGESDGMGCVMGLHAHRAGKKDDKGVVSYNMLTFRQ